MLNPIGLYSLLILTDYEQITVWAVSRMHEQFLECMSSMIYDVRGVLCPETGMFGMICLCLFIPPSSNI